MFIKKIFENKIDSSVHIQFQKFGKGIFKDRAMVKISNIKGKYVIYTTREYANELVKMLAEKLGDKKTKVNGMIITTLSLKGIDFKEKKQFRGIKKYVIDKEMSGKEILELCNKFPLALFALSFKVNGDELKIKTKQKLWGPPRDIISAKENPKIDFCKLTTKDKNLISNFIFDLPNNFKKAIIKHDFIIKELVFPKEEKDYAKLREIAKRKGKIIRKINVDNKEIIKEKFFEA
ncbi:MAG: hypothetical protein NZ889_02225 [Candidatus Pacearchaeota archaeon]|nr:hypothetical protein [Candidatus Pacearchaeota archaeon]